MLASEKVRLPNDTPIASFATTLMLLENYKKYHFSVEISYSASNPLQVLVPGAAMEKITGLNTELIKQAIILNKSVLR